MTLYITDLSDPAIYPAKVRKAIKYSNEDDRFNLITKNPGPIKDEIFAKLSGEQLNKIILQVSVTGLGHTNWEPNVPSPEDVFAIIKTIRDEYAEVPVTLRYDPIIPGINDTQKCFQAFATKAGSLRVEGVTASVLDVYPHRRLRINNMYAHYHKDINDYYPNNTKHASDSYRENTLTVLKNELTVHGISLSVCCEKNIALKATPTCEGGCDWWNLVDGWATVIEVTPGYQRGGCTCPKATQLLTYANLCHHDCVYCYRK